MNYNLNNGISFYQMKLFVTVVEQRSISKAAAILNLEQCSLSRQIAVIERDINIPLLDRSVRPIAPTPVGKTLYNDWKHLIDYFDASLSQARTSLNKTNTLSICIIDSINLIKDMPAIRAKIAQRVPGIKINFEYVSFNQWREMLLQDKTDLVFTVAFDADRLESSLKCVPVLEVPKLVCMLRSNPLSKKETITYQDLIDQDIISISKDVLPKHSQYVRQLFMDRTGYEPKGFHYISNANATICSLQQDDEVVICDCFLRDFDNPLVKAFELPNTKSALCAIWKSQNHFVDSVVKDIKDFYLGK